MLDRATPASPDPRRSAWSTIGQPARTARERILSAATELFCLHGFATTGVDTIAAQSGAAKSTLYKHFASKDKLIEAVLDAEGAAWRAWLFGRLATVEGGPRARLLGLFDVLEDWFSDEHYYGCPFINAISEAPQDEQRARCLAGAHKASLLTWLRSQALELGRDPEALSRVFVVLVDGAIVASQASGDPAFARAAKDSARAYLDSG